MISMSVTLSVLFCTSVSIANSQFDYVLNNLADEIDWHFEGSIEHLTDNEAKLKLSQFLNNSDNVELKRVHPAKLNSAGNTYGIMHLSVDTQDYRLFYYCKRLYNQHKIVKIRITKG